MIRLTVYCILVTCIVSVNCQPISESHRYPTAYDKSGHEIPVVGIQDAAYLVSLLSKLADCKLEDNDDNTVKLRADLEKQYAERLEAINLSQWVPSHIKAIRESRKEKCSVMN
ncbi:uncharacterized protein LOC103568934 [Microplitis demolitor]|uniref:uncharacterized protein LOC103568934 n=1 Tax=Microplitis demolitor TaxID=69319 RepID=UPI0004CCADA7|nr:uncharacterized protein LOC103568934 [Microplitis demolitor]